MYGFSRASPQQTLNMDNNYSVFTTTLQERSKMDSTQGSSDGIEV